MTQDEMKDKLMLDALTARAQATNAELAVNLFNSVLAGRTLWQYLSPLILKMLRDQLDECDIQYKITGTTLELT